MIKWKGKKDGRACIGFGLEDKNLERLKAGMPIYIYGAEMQLPFDVMIYYGKDMEALVKMSKSGINEDTVVRDNRQRKTH